MMRRLPLSIPMFRTRLHLAALALAALGALAPATARAAEPKKAGAPSIHPQQTACFKCHGDMDGALKDPVTRAPDDVHFLRGLSCHDCHGGNPAAFDDMEAAHDAKKGWGKPARLGVPAFCGRCHSDAAFMKRFNPHARVDQLSEYRTSVHGRRNLEKDERAAVCIDCHDVHGIRAIKDPRSPVYPTNVADRCARCHSDETIMGRYMVPTNQVADFKKSVHAEALYGRGDLSAPTCNDCHGSHGAAPPGVENVTRVCGSCHTREATLFRETEAKRKLDLSACIECMVCHSNHAVVRPTTDMLGVGETSTCTGCHSRGEPTYDAAARMGQSAAALQARLAEARDRLERAARAGVEVGPDRFALQKAADQVVELRVLAHSFDLERFLAAAEEGLKAADEGVQAGHRAFAELRFRRVGLAGSLVVIAAVIVALALYVRRMERPQQP